MKANTINPTEIGFDPCREGTLLSMELEVIKMSQKAELDLKRNQEASAAFERILEIATKHNRINSKLSADIAPIVEKMKKYTKV
jgi:hypothetical protein